MTNWIVMPCHDALSLTRDAIDTALAQDITGGVTVLAIDDASRDNTNAYLRSLYPRVRLISYGRPVGVSRAWNVALSYIFDREHAPHALVVNSDVRLRPDTYRLLVEDGGEFVTAVGTSSGVDFPGGEPSGTRRPHPDFSCFLIRRECWRSVGRFDETMRIYCGDGDMHLRMERAGIHAYCIDLPFHHVASGTLKNVDEEEKERILKIAGLDRLAFEKKWNVEMGSDDYYRLFSGKVGGDGEEEAHTEATGLLAPREAHVVREVQRADIE
jgi:glycosyltransferase involved in cell wall biosynthesis